MEAHLAARLTVLDAVVETQRRILRARDAGGVAAAVTDLVERFGGTLVPPGRAGSEAIQVDVTFGTASPLVVEVASKGTQAEELRRLLPGLAEDASRMISRLDARGGVDLAGGDAADHPFVILSEVGIEDEGAETLERAFQDRLGEVDAFEGFLGLQVWRDRGDPGRFVMVGWWRRREDYVAYMRSAAHDRSHERVPTDPVAPRAVGAGQFDVVAE